MRRMKLAGGLEGAGSLLSGFSAAIVQKVRSSWAPSTPFTPGLLPRPIPVSLVIALLGAFCAMPAFGAPAASITTTLALTSGGSATTSVSQGTVVTLTATVMAGGAPVHPGLVEFCDASGAACTDVHLLNTTGLNGSGVATFSLVPGPGNHSYKAVFLTAGVKHTSTSTTLPLTVTPVTTTVTPPLPTYTLMSVSGPASYSTFTGAVSGFVPYSALPPYPSPTGTVSFLDITNGSAPVATGSLSGNVLGSGLGPASLIATANPSGVAVADLNGDGIPDVVAENSAPGTVSVFLGNGDGTFKTAVIYGAGGIGYGAGGLGYPDVISIGDFNGDGIPDIVTVNDGSPGAIAVLTGRGDGTFNTAVTTNLGASNYFYIFVADLNQDGLEDLIITGPSPNGTGSGFTEYLSNGDGTFRDGPYLTFDAYLEDYPVPLLLFGDFTGDGQLDLLYDKGRDSPETSVTYLAVNFGNGDSNFIPGPTSARFTSPKGFVEYPFGGVVGDFNRDGLLDVALLPWGNDQFSISIFDGNGDGTFSHGGQFRLPLGAYIITGDFNGDGNLDVLALGATGGPYKLVWKLGLMLGNGDGTFSPMTEIATNLVAPNGLAFYGILRATDLNGDGNLDIVFQSGDSGVGVLLGNGDGTFQPPVYYTTPLQANAEEVNVTIADFNSDGHQDVMIGNGGTAWLLMGQGDGTLRLGKMLTCSRGGITGGAADFNADGLVDVVVTVSGPDIPGTAIFLQK